MLTTLENEIISRILKPMSILAKTLSPKELPSHLPNLWNITPGVTLLKPSIKNEIEFPNGIRIFLTPYMETFRTFVNKFLSLWIHSGIM